VGALDILADQPYIERHVHRYRTRVAWTGSELLDLISLLHRRTGMIFEEDWSTESDQSSKRSAITSLTQERAPLKGLPIWKLKEGSCIESILFSCISTIWTNRMITFMQSSKSLKAISNSTHSASSPNVPTDGGSLKRLLDMMKKLAI
jgi:hypothetical protein